MRGLLALTVTLPALVGGHMVYRDSLPNSLNVPSSVAIGHVNPHGGSSLNAFGRDFKAQEYRWTPELCEMDSDGDGLSNGHELGDPCCVWQEGDLPMRTFALSHPGDVHSVNSITPPACVGAEGEGKGGPSALDPVALEDAEFWAFYYESREAQLSKQAGPVAAAYQTMKEVSQRKNNCGFKGLHNDTHCGVCGACCREELAADPERCDACVEDKCVEEERVKPEVCPMPGGAYQHSCDNCVVGPGCVLTCDCLDSYQVFNTAVCRIGYCGSGGNLDNKYGKLVCHDGLDFCKATHKHGESNRLLGPMECSERCPHACRTHIFRGGDKSQAGCEAACQDVCDAGHSSSGSSLEGLLASLVGSYKTSDELAGDASKAVGNLPATLIVFACCAVTLLFDTGHMLRSALSPANGLLLFGSAVYIELFSGLLHIVLDNPLFVTWPLLGPQCESFQTHHVSPTRILTLPWFGYLCEHHTIIVVMLVCSLFLGSPEHRRPVRVFSLYAVGMSELMMASHRWTHMRPTATPWLVQAGQWLGLLMPVRMHSYHHVTYDTNFAIFTGWLNWPLNVATQVVHPHSRVWLAGLIAVCAMPAVLSHPKVHRPLLSVVQTVQQPVLRLVSRLGVVSRLRTFTGRNKYKSRIL